MDRTVIRSFWSLVIAACFATPVAAAARTWIVDAAGGPGFHFLDIPPALEVAQDGDTILVRSGVYNGGSITRSIAILAAPGASPRVRIPAMSFFAGAFDVTGLAANRSVVIQGMALEFPSSFAVQGRFVNVTDCAGRVHCDRLDLNLSNLTFQETYIGVSVWNSAHVSVRGSTFQGGLPMKIYQSTVLIGDSVLAGQDALAGTLVNQTSSPAIAISHSRLTLSRTTVLGGDGRRPLVGSPAPPSPAIHQMAGATTIAGSQANRIEAGSLAGSSEGVSAIEGSGGTLEVDPRVVVPSISAGHHTTLRRIPSLSATSVPPGGTMAIQLLATAGDSSEIYVSLPFGPVPSPIPGSGEIWVDFGMVIVLGRFSVPSSEQLSLSLLIPANAAFGGVPLTLQALTVSSSTGFRFSTPSTVVLH